MMISGDMIRAKPNSVRWDEINRVKYKFQAFNLPSDLLENLVLSSPPLGRRERASTSPERAEQQSSRNEKQDPSFKRLTSGTKSASLDECELSSADSGHTPKRKLSVVDAPSLDCCMSKSRQPYARIDSENSFDEELEFDGTGPFAASVVSTSTPEDKPDTAASQAQFPDKLIQPIKTVAESSDSSSTTNESHSNSKETTSSGINKLPLKKYLSCITEEDDLMTKSKEELVQIIHALQQRSQQQSCDRCSADTIDASSQCEDQLEHLSLSHSSGNSQGTQTPLEGVESQKPSQGLGNKPYHSNRTSPCISNQLDMLETEVQQVYNVSSLFNNELASVQARLGSLILKSESLTQGFKLMATETQVGLTPLKLDKRISVEALHPMSVINTDC